MGAAHEFIEMILQSVAYKLSDMINEYPREIYPAVLAVIHMTCDSLEKLMDEDEKLLFEHFMDRSEIAILPTSFDPRETD